MSYQSRLRRLKSFIWLKRSFPFLWPRSLGKLPCLQASWQETDFPVPMGDTPAAPSQNQGAKFKVHLILDLAFLWRSQLPRHNSHCINTPWPVQVRMFPLTTKLSVIYEPKRLHARLPSLCGITVWGASRENIIAVVTWLTSSWWVPTISLVTPCQGSIQGLWDPKLT